MCSEAGEEVEVDDLCYCPCHLNLCLHMFPCCYECPDCKKMIKVECFVDHLKHCQARRPSKLEEKPKLSRPNRPPVERFAKEDWDDEKYRKEAK